MLVENPVIVDTFTADEYEGLAERLTMKIDELLIGPIDGLRAFLHRNSAVRRPLMPILKYFSRFLNMQPADNSAADYRRWVAAFDTLDDNDREVPRYPQPDQACQFADCPVDFGCHAGLQHAGILLCALPSIQFAPRFIRIGNYVLPTMHRRRPTS